MLNKVKNKNIFPISWVFLFIFFLVLRMGELHNIASYVEWLFILATPFVAYTIRNDRQLAIQMFIIDLYFGAVWGFALINKLAHKNHKALIFVGAIVFLSCAIILLKEVLLYIKSLDYIAILKLYWPLFIPIILFIALSFETIFEIPWHDAEYYYCWEIKKISYWFDYTWGDISDYTLAGHFSLGYALIALLAELIYPQNAIVLHSFNIILAIISGISLYRIFDLVYPNKSKYMKTVCVSIYLLSPWILGIIGYINIDTPSIYFFIILLSCYFYNRKVWMAVLSFLFVYTKEPSVVYYSFFLLGIVISELILKRIEPERKTNNIIKEFFCVIKEHILEILIVISWLICFILRYKSGWGVVQGNLGNSNAKIHCFGFTFQNLWMKFKGVMILNFNWIFTIIIVSLSIKKIIQLTISKEKSNTDEVLKYRCLIILSFIGFILFNLSYLDLDHPRYNAIGAVLFILIGIDMLINLKEGVLLKGIVTAIAVLLVIQSMITIDPLSKIVFGTVDDYGDSEILSRVHFVYNREYSYYYGAINKILKECNYDGTQDISMFNVFPPYGPLNDYWWDTKACRMTPVNNTNTIIINFVFDKEGYNEFNPDHSKIIIYPYSANISGEYEVATYRTFSLKYQKE